MDENAVVKATCKYLKEQGYTILSSCTTNQRGVDIIAENLVTGYQMLVEAKGNTSSKEGSKRFGQPYTNSQVFSHASKGVFACIRLRAKHSDRTTHKVMLAVPDSTLYNKYLDKSVIKDLESAGIDVLFI